MPKHIRHPFWISYPLLSIRVLSTVERFESLQYRSPTINELSFIIGISEEYIIESMEFGFPTKRFLIDPMTSTILN